MQSGKQVALVIGASRGIGRQIAIDLAREGYAGITPLSSPHDQFAVRDLKLQERVHLQKGRNIETTIV